MAGALRGRRGELRLVAPAEQPETLGTASSAAAPGGDGGKRSRTTRSPIKPARDTPPGTPGGDPVPSSPVVAAPADLGGFSTSEGSKGASRPPDDIPTLHAIVSAQRWDIQGLKEQLREANQRNRDLEAELGAKLDAAERRREDAEERLRAEHDSAIAYRDVFERLRRAVFTEIWTLFGKPAGGAEAFLTVVAILESGLFDEAYYRRQCRDDEIPDGMPALLHYVRAGEQAGRAPHPLFDAAYYRSQAEPDQRPTNLLAHYLTQGRTLAPNPLFSPDHYVAQFPELVESGINPLVHYRAVGVASRATPHLLFDVEHYRRQLRERGLPQPDDPLAHYLVSAPAGVSPHRLFDANFYCSSHPEVEAEGLPPLVHFLLVGEARDWNPHAWFHTRYYRRGRGKRVPATENALVHYVRHGAEEDRAPHPAFDPAYYRAACREQQPATSPSDPLVHFLQQGLATGCNPHPLIDLAHIRGQLGSEGLHPNALAALLAARAGERRIAPHWLFDPEYYADRCPAAADASGGPFYFYLLQGWKLDQGPHPLFDPVYYRAQAAERGFEIGDPLAHFVETGGALGISPHPLFDVAYYLKHNPEVAEQGLNPLQHYLTLGDRLGRDPHPLFSTAYYKRQAGLNAGNALLHYVKGGSASTIDPHELFETRYYLAQLPEPLSPGTTPLAHYLTDPEGMRVSPFPLFDQAFVRAQLSGAVEDSTPLLCHYLEQMPEHAPSPHPLFDPAFFHDTVGYSQAALLEYVGNLRLHAVGGYQPHRMHFHEANRHFCTISYLLDRPELLDGSEIPMGHFAKSADWRRCVEPAKKVKRAARAGVVAEPYRPAEYVPGRLLEIAREQARSASSDVSPDDALFRRGSEANLAALFESTRPRVAASAERLSAHAAKSGRVALYAAHLPDGRLKAYHRATLAALREAGYATVLINSTETGAAALAEEADRLAEAVMIRSGEGRDFASWILAAAHFAPALAEARHVVLMNDSLVGPFGDLAATLRSLEGAADIGALSESLEIHPHLQSSLLLLSRGALFSAAVIRFMLNFQIPARGARMPVLGDAGLRTDPARRGSTRWSVVRSGEISFSAETAAAGLGTHVAARYAALARAWLQRIPEQLAWAHDLPERIDALGLGRMFPGEAANRFSLHLQDWLLDRAARVRADEPFNPQHVFWDALLAKGDFPFLKKELLLTNPLRIPTVVRLCDRFEGDARCRALELLRDLVQPAPGFPHSYLRLSDALLEAVRD